MSHTLDLPPVLDLIAAPLLLESLTGHRGQTLTLDAGNVQRLGAQCLQVLLAARAAWAADGQALALENPSDEFTATLALLGSSTAELTHSPPAQGIPQQNKELVP